MQKQAAQDWTTDKAASSHSEAKLRYIEGGALLSTQSLQLHAPRDYAIMVSACSLCMEQWPIFSKQIRA